MADEDKAIEHFCVDHNVCYFKLRELCEWKAAHEKFHREEAALMKDDHDKLLEKIDHHKTLLVGALVALVINLMATIIKFV
jgi:hypothetical protein